MAIPTKEQLRSKCEKEYQAWLQHIQTIRDEKRQADKKILEKPPEGFIKSNLMWKNMQLETATFLTDELDVVIVSDKWVLEDDITRQAENVARYDYRKMEMKEIKRKIIDDNNLYGLSATFIEWFDDDDIIPLVNSIDALSIIPDPKNYSGSKMRFIGLEKQMSIGYIRDNEKFDKQARESAVATVSNEWMMTEQARATAQWVVSIPDDEMASVNYHFTTYEGMKYMTVWMNDFNDLLRIVEIESMTKSEKLNPSKVRFPIQLHRRKPIPNSFYGASLYDELIDYQKLESELISLKALWVRIEELGNDKILNQKLGIDINIFNKVKAGWGTFEGNFENLGNEPAFVELPVNKTGWRVDWMLQQVRKYSEESTQNYSQSFGQSPWGQQTKAEMQILDRNSNRWHRMVRDNYMDSYELLWEDIFKAYEQMMPEKGLKNIALIDKGLKTSKTLRKKEFLSGGTINIYIESQEEKRARDSEDFTKLVTVSNLVIGNMKPWYAMNEFMRLILTKSGIDQMNPYIYVPETPDEIEAKGNLELLNNDVEIVEPLPNQDLHTLRQIYSQALPTDARKKILERIDQLIMDQVTQEQVTQTDSASASMAMNSVLSKDNSNPTLWL